MRTVVGYRRKTKRKEGGRTPWAEVYFALGILMLGGMLAFPMARGEAGGADFTAPEAVAVMSVTGGGARDVLAEPDRYAAVEEDWSLFDEIGLFFANLIRGV